MSARCWKRNWGLIDMAENVYSEVEEKIKVEDWRVIFRLWKYTRPYLPILIISMIFILGTTALDLLPPYLSKTAIDKYMDATHEYFVQETAEGVIYTEAEGGPFKLEKNDRGAYVVTDGENEYPVSEAELQRLRLDDLNGIGRIALYMLLILISLFFLNYGQVYLTSYMGQKITHGIRLSLFEHLIRLPMRFFDTNSSGRLAT